MWYAKNSENKKRNMAIDHEEGKLWMSYLNLSRFNRDREDEESQEPTSSVEDMDIDPPPAEDTPSQNKEDLVSPLNSGLQFPMKGSLVLMFSILLIFFDKKKRKADSTRSNDDEPKIGANKVSDFLLFWIIPYLCRYTQQKVREIVKHHQEHNQQEFRSVCKKSSFDIIKEAMLTCGFPAELKTTILSKYKDFYGTEQLEYKVSIMRLSCQMRKHFLKLQGTWKPVVTTSSLQVCPEGCSDIVLSIGVVTTREKHLSVCFSYPQGTGGKRVADLFQAIGAHYLDHFSLVILHGLCRNDQDPDYKVGSLYPVSGIRKVIFTGEYPQLAEKSSFSTSQGKFCRAEVPETYKLWDQEKPARSYKLRAVNLNGSLLYNIEKSGRKGNIAVVLCIKDTFGSFGSCLPTLPEATKVIIVNFVRAVVAAGLPKVYPSKADEEDRDEIERGFPDEEEEMEDMDETSEDEPSASGQDPAVKKGNPENDELEQLANDIDPSYWTKVGRKLKIDDPKITAIDKENEEFSEKKYKMLLHWKQKNGRHATWKELYQALVNVNLRDSAEKHCCKEMN
ncbi:hypothetical protein AWC38_SpisGene21981 [Stylophora pistillata]|uniref:Death domain-containing protein n=1 Tax=Stylophora pistillata TaxID=50429 RepID=A0A2B4R9S8_STYPI|nr:hypothetical protein AWC38_SpisGene21981 [Stylophora pistillata]